MVIEIDIEKVPLKDLTGKALENKLLIIDTGSNAIRLVPALSVTMEEMMSS